MEHNGELTQTISPKIISIWRLQFMRSYTTMLLILGIVLLIAHYFHWYMWILFALYIVTAVLFIQTIYKLTIYPHLLQQSWRYQIDNDFIQIHYGFLHFHRTIISTKTIQKVHIHQPSLLHKAGLANVIIQTCTTHIQIPAITLEDAKYIKKKINELNTVHAIDSERMKKDSYTPLTQIYDLSWRNFQLLSVTSCYIFILLLLFLMVYMKLNDIFSFEQYTTTFLHTITTSSFIFLTAVIAMIIFSFILAMIYNFARLGTYQVATNDMYIHITQGRLKQVNTVIPKSYIEGFTIQKPLTHMPLGFVKVQLILADRKEHQSSLTTNLLFPFISSKDVKSVIQNILPIDQQTYEKARPTFSNEAYFAELIQPNYMLVIITFFFMFFWPEYWFVPVIYVLFIIVKRILNIRQQSYLLTSQAIQINNGNFSTYSTFLLPRSIERIDFDQTWIQHKLGLVSVIFTTKTYPNYTFKLDHVKKEVANEICSWYQHTL